MADILASVSVVLGAEVSGFKAAMADARRELKGLVQFSQGLQDVGSNLTRAVSAPLVLLGAGAVAASAKLESLKNGLQAIAQQELGKRGITGLVAVQQAAQQTGERIQVLQQIAKQPGLGFETAEQADIRLRAVGISAEQSAKSIKAFANAIATTGGGKTEFGTVTTQLSQLGAKGKVLAQDLRPIIEAAPAVAAALQTLYGTVDSETISASLAKQGQSSKDFIRILTDELAKLPQVTGGLKAIYENDLDALLVASAKVGDGIAKAFDLQAVGERLGNTITAIGDGFANLSAPTQAAIVTFAGLAAATGPVLLGLGTLGVALPAIKAGFVAAQSGVTLLTSGLASLLNPTTLVIAGLAAAAAAVYYFATANERAVATYQEQAKQTTELVSNTSALVARYNELSATANRSAAEQTELTGIIKQLAATVPGATTAIDNYGNATAISTQKITAYTQALQQQKAANAALALPGAEARLKEIGALYTSLKKQADEFNRTGTIQATGPSLGAGAAPVATAYRAGSEELAKFQAELANANVEFQKQKALVDELRGSTKALAEEDASLANALMSVGLAGGRTSGILADLREQLKKIKEERENEVTEKDIFADNAVIKSLEKEIARLEGTDKAGKKATDAITKLRQELARLTALDNLLGDTPSQLQVLERRSDTLAKGLKTLVDAGVSTSSKAFQGFAADLVRTSQAADRLIASTGQIGAKTVNVKSLIPTTIGDTLPQDVARLLGDYAKQLKPFELPVPVKLNMQAITDAAQPVKLGNFEVSKDLYKGLLDIGNGYQQASAAAQVFGVYFDEGQAKAGALRTSLESLIASGLSPTSEALKQLGADYQKTAALADINTAATAALKGAIGQAVTGIAQYFGQLASGAASLEDFGNVLLTQVGKIATSLGESLIAAGVGAATFQTLLSNPYTAIAAGAALVAVGAALGSFSSTAASVGKGGGSGGSSSPTVINYGQTSNQTTIKVLAEFHLRGKDFIAFGQQKDYRSKVTG